jgi:H+-transporting ATPase
MNGVVGFWQEHKADNAIELLKERLAPTARVSGSIVRQGEMTGLVFATGMNTYFSRTAKLVELAKTPSHFQKAVVKIGDYLII